MSAKTIFRVSALMAEFEQEVLRRYTSCNSAERAEVIRALAEVHTEFVLMLGARGNPTAESLFGVIKVLQEVEHVQLQVKAARVA